ncbi:MAG TPA: ATP-dependent DNA helicase RecG [Fibrobacteria bacterium]|nr:ATP-dependent DNA helicase RecG [Fibrobacteria bacterium]
MSDLSRLTGVGPKREKILAEAGISTLRDLIYHLPRRYVDRTKFTPIAELAVGKDAIFPCTVRSISMAQMRMMVTVEDGSGTVELVFFNGVQFLRNRFSEGQRMLIAGVPGYFREIQMVHPEFQALKEGEEIKGEVLPRYPLTVDMSEAHVEHKFLQKIALEALQGFSFSDPLQESHRRELSLLPEADLLRALHKPATAEEIPALRRQLKVRELLPLSLRLEAVKAERRKVGKAWPASAALKARLREGLPFTLTAGQAEAVEAISACQARPGQFCGLLMGDVGSGKTVVAMLTAANVLEAGGQVALMAPTEILAAQHHQTLAPFLAQAGIRAGLLTGETPKADREAMAADLASGKLPFIVGTHALYSGDVRFRELGLAIIDEQHRFGVQQRQALSAKGGHPDILYMSATPIPRTLAQTVFGDLENFVLTGKPAGRLPVKTRLVQPEKRKDMLGFLLKEALGGNQVFWVVPQIGAKEPPPPKEGNAGRAGKAEVDPDIFIPRPKRPEEDLASVGKIQAELAAYSQEWKIGIVHGKLPPEKKEAALTAFRKGQLHVLVATTVIEVGVDVPQANLMVIESPDRFGVAQLHQLRGRTGRGSAQAWCFLSIPDRAWPVETHDRVAGFAETTDGFKIAEMDLRSRGTGNLEGTDQSGYGGLRFTDLIEDFALTQEIRKYAETKVGGAEGG